MPSNVSFPDVSFSSARVIWDVPAEPNGEILAYRVTYFIDSTQATNTSKEFAPSDRTYRVTNLEAEQFYMFHIAARTSLGWGQAARALVYTTNSRDAPQPPSAPHVSPSQIQSQQITFSWAPGRDGFAPLRYCFIFVSVSNVFETKTVFFSLDITRFNTEETQVDHGRQLTNV